MLPIIPTRYPEFVSDQVLTATNLNDMFGYLDRQVRMTRTNLIGIGIVCGLHVRVSDSGDAITITKGCGVTSSGYLVTLPTTTYTFYNDEFTAEREEYYDRFVDLSTKKQRFPLWELAEAGSTAAKKELTTEFLEDKVVLVFVELLQQGNKNCDPDSCDDKGRTVTVTFRPLLVERKNADALLGGEASEGFSRTGFRCAEWPQLRMPRYDVPATSLPDTAKILQQFLRPLGSGFLSDIQTTFSQAYAAMQLLVNDILPSNPFQSLKSDYAFLNDGSIRVDQLIHAQYYYDHFSDLLQAYDELRDVCNDALAVCCPDEEAFPRHLLLGRATGADSKYRHRFIPSPAVCCGGNASDRLRMLLLRLARLVRQLQLPVQLQERRRKRLPIRYTPSTLGPEALSVKAIPYYYDVLAGSPALYELWNEQKLRIGTGKTNLSYHASLYNSSDDWVRTPLQFDLEPYNFLRVEGHIGTHWRSALGELLALKARNRLPVDVVAMNGDFATLAAMLRDSLRDMSRSLKERPEDWKEIICLFGDLETQYDAQVAELRCSLGTVMRFLHEMPIQQLPDSIGQSTKLASRLVKDFDSTYQVREQSYGAVFSAWYPRVKDQPYSSMMQLGFTASFNESAFTAAPTWQYPLLLMYRLEKIYEALPEEMLQLQLTDVTLRMRDAAGLATVLLRLAGFANDDNAAIAEEYRLHLDAVIRLCKAGLLRELYASLIERFKRYMQSQTFAMYAYMHSGIQHKAGVPMGGTFVIVYHQKGRARQSVTIGEAANTITAEAREEPTTASANDSAERILGEVAVESFTEHSSGMRRVGSTESIARGISSSRHISDLLLREVAERAKEDSITDKEMLELVAEIPDGTVIADFYLPYICASSCPPINFICLGSDEKPEPSIKIDGTDFCAADKGSYAIDVTPQGGTLTSDGGGLKPNEDGSFSFVPTGVDLADGDTTTVTLKYTVDDVSVTTQLRVHRAPRASFRVEPSPAARNGFHFINTSTFATSYRWEFGDGSTDTAESPLHTYDEFGTFTVQLTASNDFCPDHAATQTVTLAQEGEQANCTKLEELHDMFVKLDDGISDTAREQFAPYKTAANIFLKQLPKLFPLPPQEQALKLVGMLPPDLILTWMEQLHAVILRLTRGRSPFIELYRILNAVLMFYACVQEGDFDQDPIPTQKAFERHLKAFLGTWRQNAPKFNNAEQGSISNIATDVEKEAERISTTARNKKKYLRFLKGLLETLGALRG
ncbi:PKD domain-containing protein [bacterium]|nr:PKD domain-containing protein [bacterium]